MNNSFLNFTLSKSEEIVNSPSQNSKKNQKNHYLPHYLASTNSKKNNRADNSSSPKSFFIDFSA